MTKEEKVKFKLERAEKRRTKKWNKYIMKINVLRNLGLNKDVAKLSLVDRNGYIEFWRDTNSPTGFSQKCSYEGICQHPCNGDC